MKQLVITLALALVVSCAHKEPYDFQSTIPVELKIMQQKAHDMEMQEVYDPISLAAIKNNIAIGMKAHLETEVMKYQTNYINLHNKELPIEQLDNFKAEIKYDSLMFIYNYDIELFKGIESDTLQ